MVQKGFLFQIMLFFQTFDSSKINKKLDHENICYKNIAYNSFQQ